MLKDVLEMMPAYSIFNFWFRPSKNLHNVWVVATTTDLTTEIGRVDAISEELNVELFDGVDTDKQSIRDDFKLFKNRPEYLLTKPVDAIEMVSQEMLIEEYETRLVGVALTRSRNLGKNPDEAMGAIMKCIDWLRSTDFYVAPGSTQYHDSEPSGLLKHSLRVFNHSLRLKYDDAFMNIDFDSAALVALTHDWCKIGLYEMFTRNVKNEETGKWEQVPSYRHNQRGIPLGHGVSSMFLVSKFFRLSPEEAIAIRWHMGEYNVADNERNELHLSNETYPSVFLIQFADRLAITQYAN